MNVASPPRPVTTGTDHWRSIISVPIAAFALVLSFTAWDSWRQYTHTIAHAYEVLDARTQIAETSLAGTIQHIDARLKEVAALRLTIPTADIPGFSVELERRRQLIPSAAVLMTINDQGIVDAHTAREVLGFDATQREHFRVHADRTAGDRLPHFSQPFMSARKTPVVTLSRPIVDADGGFRGVTAAAILLDQLMVLVAPAKPEAQSALAITGNGGAVLIQLPHSAEVVGKPLNWAVRASDNPPPLSP